MPAGKGWPGMREPGYIRWDRQLAESHVHSRKAEVSVSLTDFLPPTRCHTFSHGGGGGGHSFSGRQLAVLP